MTVKEENGRWYCQFMIDGKRYHKSIPEATKKREAEKAEAIIKSELLRGKYGLIEGKKYKKLGDLIKIYLDYSKENKESYDIDKRTTKLFLEFSGDININEITPFFIEKWKKYRRNSKARVKIKDGFKELDRLVSKSTVNRENRSLSKMFSIAVKNHWISSNPFFEVDKYREENKKKIVLSLEEEKTISEALEKTFVYHLFLVALYTGMRMGEVRLIEWANVDLKEKCIDVLKTKSGVPRQIYLPDWLVEELSGIKVLGKYVFMNPKTLEPYSRNAPYQRMVDECAKIGIVGVTPHVLRHTAATRMAEQGIDVITMQDIFGWATLKLVQRYSHAINERKKEAINKLGEYKQKACDIPENYPSKIIALKKRG